MSLLKKRMGEFYVVDKKLQMRWKWRMREFRLAKYKDSEVGVSVRYGDEIGYNTQEQHAA